MALGEDQVVIGGGAWIVPVVDEVPRDQVGHQVGRGHGRGGMTGAGSGTRADAVDSQLLAELADEVKSLGRADFAYRAFSQSAHPVVVSRPTYKTKPSRRLWPAAGRIGTALVGAADDRARSAGRNAPVAASERRSLPVPRVRRRRSASHPRRADAPRRVPGGRVRPAGAASATPPRLPA